jgi:hypothetical protein
MGLLVRELTHQELWNEEDGSTMELRSGGERGQVLVQSLEKVCGRAALLAGTIKSHAGAGLGLHFDGGMAYDLCKDQRCSV